MNTGTSTRTNLDGKVINTHGDLKLTNQSVHDLTLTAGLKYDQRKNNTASDTYSYWNLNSVSTPADNYIGINTPYSNRAIQEELAADYRITSSQKIRLAFDHENVKRWCENVASGLQCVSSPKSKEDKIGVNYKLKAFEDFTFKTDYSYAIRKGEFDHNFNSNIGTKYVVGGSPGTRTTINGGDLYGFVAFPYEGRKEHLVKASVNWQPTEKLDLGLSANYKKDNYTADLGVRNANSKGANLDTTYNFSDATSMSLYVDWQNGYRDMYEGNTSTTTGLKSDGSNTVAPSIVWSNRLKEDSRAIGLVGNHKGLMGGKMDIAGDLSYALDKSTYSTAVPYAVSLTLLCSNPTLLSCGSLPDIKSSLVTVKLSDSYQLDKNSKVALGYTYQHRIVQDYLYNIYQAGYTPATLMPTNEQAPSYNVSMLTVSYSYTF
jgi:MtrB/PioB family decaheme-associated outer membrane protein